MFSGDKKEASDFNYEGIDLEAMSQADNYYAWIASIIRPYLGKDIVEVGAGVGSFSKLLMQAEPRTLSVLDPSLPTFRELGKNIIPTKTTDVVVFNDYLKGVSPKLKGTVDTFVYINVFEHIEDDAAELKLIADTLKPGGHVVVFVPALQALYGKFDKNIGHYRRYTKTMLRDLAAKADMEVAMLRYMDMPGIIPWWVSMVLMGREQLMPNMVKLYDSLCVPIIRAIETRLEAPIGKNVLLIAKKRGT